MFYWSLSFKIFFHLSLIDGTYNDGIKYTQVFVVYFSVKYYDAFLIVFSVFHFLFLFSSYILGELLF